MGNAREHLQELIALLVTTKCISIAGVAASEDVGQPIGCAHSDISTTLT